MIASKYIAEIVLQNTLVLRMMMATHKLNRAKVIEELKRLGWTLADGVWTIPEGRTTQQQNNNWEQAVLNAIECPHEVPSSS